MPELRQQPRHLTLGGAFVPAQTTIVVGSGSGPGSVINAAVTVLRGLATRACGKASWICSPSESVSATKRVGGMPA